MVQRIGEKLQSGEIVTPRHWSVMIYQVQAASHGQNSSVFFFSSSSIIGRVTKENVRLVPSDGTAVPSKKKHEQTKNNNKQSGGS